MSIVYLLHFERPIGSGRHYAQHYIGRTNSLKRRVAEHRAGNGARITQVIREQGIGFTVVKTWRNGTRKLERRLKNQKHAWRHCNICREARKEKNHVLPLL